MKAQAQSNEARKKKSSSSASGAEEASYDPARALSLPSVAPPLLSLNADMHGLIAFLERFQQYQNLGGTIELHQCLDPIILQKMIMVDITIETSNQEVLLYKHYCPRGRYINSVAIESDEMSFIK
jgi:hypothetical protein